jgi:CheY-like chemotaxis protein
MKTILLVDDDPETLITLTETLEISGHNVIPKPDAESALSLIREGTKIDLVSTDLRMLE